MNSDRTIRQKALFEALESRILVLDGAMGTMIQQRGLTAADFGGAEYEGCNEVLARTRPDVIRDIHRAYFAAGSDIVETDSFQSSLIVLAEYGLENQVHEINVAAARVAREAAEEFSKPGKPRFVAGSIGPTTKSLTLKRDVSFEQMRQSYYAQAKGLVEGGVDILLLETAFDTLNIKAGLLAIRDLERELGFEVPIMISARSKKQV